jgi:hypothetical protein
MLDSLLLLNSLTDAMKLIGSARIVVAGSSSVVWEKLYNAQKYLDTQVALILSDN